MEVEVRWAIVRGRRFFFFTICMGTEFDLNNFFAAEKKNVEKIKEKSF